jgi:hypothetical protein
MRAYVTMLSSPTSQRCKMPKRPRTRTPAPTTRRKTPAGYGPIGISFRYLDRTHPEFCFEACPPEFLACMLRAIGFLNCQSSAYWQHCYDKRPLHPKNITLPKEHSCGRTFGFERLEDVADPELIYELAITRRGRVHGFVDDDLFHIVWLDPDHFLCDGGEPQGDCHECMVKEDRAEAAPAGAEAV